MGSLPGQRVSAVIVHYRTPLETGRAAHAVAEVSPGAEILVVDNYSGEAIAEALSRSGSPARVVAEAANRGYGSACNRGARETARPYILFLNSDAYLRPGAVERLVAALDADPRAAAAGPKLLNLDGTPQTSIRRLPTPWRIFCESSGVAFLSGGRGVLSGHAATRQNHETARPVEALHGPALLVRRTAFEEVGGFDEDFFLYAEETDLFARLGGRGWRILYEPRAEIAHEGGRSGGDALFGQLHASLVRYARKHHGKGAARWARVVLDGGAAVRYAAAMLTPGEKGRIRRKRYRAALSRSGLQ